MKGSKITIDDRASKLRHSFNGQPLPEINGCNFFTGDYDARNGLIGMTSSDPDTWDMFWRSIVKQEPPGKLPDGAMAIMIAHDTKGDPVEYFPESAVHENDGTTVRWQRRHLKADDQPDAKSQFAVLLIPDGDNTEYYTDVDVAEEKRKAAELKKFTEGTEGAVPVGPAVKLVKKKKHKP